MSTSDTTSVIMAVKKLKGNINKSIYFERRKEAKGAFKHCFLKTASDMQGKDFLVAFNNRWHEVYTILLNHISWKGGKFNFYNSCISYINSGS